MMASRGMGAINPRKMPTKKVIHRTDNPDDVDMYKEGGGVNAAGNYTKPTAPVLFGLMFSKYI